MQRLNRFHPRAFAQCWLLFSVLGAVWIIPTKAHADEEKPRAVLEQPIRGDSPQEPVFSGPQLGEKVKPFKVLRVSSDETKEIEVVKEGDGDRVTLICFVHRLSNDDRILFGLGLVDYYVKRYKDLTSHFVLLSDDRAKMTKMLRSWSGGSLFTKSAVTLSVDGAGGPGYYGLNRNVAMTVVVAKGNKVVSNLVFSAPNNRDLQKIMAAVAKAHSKPAPTLAKVQQELRAERKKEMEKRMKASPVFKLAPNEQLGSIMFGMVNARGNRIQSANRRTKQLLEWAGDDKERRATLKKYCKGVLEGEFQLDRYASAAIQKLASD